MTTGIAHESDLQAHSTILRSHQLHVQDEMEYLDLLEVMNEHFEQLEVQKHEHMRDKHSKQRTARPGQGGQIEESFDRDLPPPISKPTDKLFQSTESWRFASLLDSSISSDSTSPGSGINVLQSIQDGDRTVSTDIEPSMESVIENNVLDDIWLEPTTRKTVPIEVTTMPPKNHYIGTEIYNEEVSKANDDHLQPAPQKSDSPTPSPSLSEQSSSTIDRDAKEPTENEQIEHNLAVALDPSKQSASDKSFTTKDSDFLFHRSSTAERKTRHTQFLAKGRSMADPEIRSNMKKTFGFQRKRIYATEPPDEDEANKKLSPPTNHVDTPRQLPLSIPLKIYERQETNLESNQLTNDQIPTSENVPESNDNDYYSKPLVATTIQKSVPQKILFTNHIDNRPAGHDQVRHDNTEYKTENMQQSVSVSLKRAPEIAIRARLVIDGKEEPLRAAEEHFSQRQRRSKEKSHQVTVNEPRKKFLPAVTITKSSLSSVIKDSAVRRKASKAIQQNPAKRKGMVTTKKKKPSCHIQRGRECDSESTTSTQSSASTGRSIESNSLALLDELEQYQTNLQAATKKAQGAMQMQFDKVQDLADRAMQRLTNFADFDRHIQMQMDENVSKAQMLSETILKAEHDTVSKIQEFRQREMENRTNQAILRTFGSLKEPKDDYGHLLKPPTWSDDAEISIDDQKKIIDELEECRNVILELAGQFDSKTFKEDSETLMRQREQIFLELGSSVNYTPHSLAKEFETMWQCVMNAPVSLPEETNELYQSGQADTEAIYWTLQRPEFESSENTNSCEHANLVEGILEFSVLHKARNVEALVVPLKNENEDSEDVIKNEHLDSTKIREEPVSQIAAEEGEVLSSTCTRNDANIQHEIMQQVHGVTADVPRTTTLVVHDIDSERSKTSDVSDRSDQRVNEEEQRNQRSPSSTKDEERDTTTEFESVTSRWAAQRENDILMQELQQQIEQNRMEAESSSTPPVKRDIISLRAGIHELKSDVNDEEECASDRASESGILYKNYSLPRHVNDDAHTALQPQLSEVYEMRNDDEGLVQKELHRMSEQVIEVVSHEILHRIISERNAINTDAIFSPKEKKSEAIFTQIHLFSPDLIQFCIDNGIALDGPELKATVADMLRDIIKHSSIDEGGQDNCEEEEVTSHIGVRNVDPLKDIDPLDSITESIYNLLQKIILEFMLCALMDSISEQPPHDLRLEQVPPPESEKCKNMDDANEVEKALAQDEDKHTTVVTASLEHKTSGSQNDGEKKEKKNGYFESIFSDLGDRESAFFELLDNVVSRTVERNAPNQQNRKLSQHVVSEISHRPPGVNMEIQTSATYSFFTPQSQSTQTQAAVKKMEETQVQTSKADQADVLVQTDKIYEQSLSESDKSEVPQSDPSSKSPPVFSLFTNRQNEIHRRMMRKGEFSLGPSDAEKRLRRALHQYTKRNPHISMDLDGSDSSNHTVQTFDTCSSGSSHTITSDPLLSFNDSDLDVHIRALWIRAKEQHGSIWTSSSNMSAEENHFRSETSDRLDNRFSNTTTYEDSANMGYSDDDDEEEEEEINLSSSLLLYEESENSSSYGCGDEDLDSFATGSSLDHSFHDMRFEGDREQSPNLVHQDLGNVIARLLNEELATVDMANLYDDDDDTIGSSSTE